MINIITNNYKTTPISYNAQSTKQYLKYKSLKTDTVSFTSRNLLTLKPEKITDVVMDTILLTPKIGFGSEGNVYKIPNSKYCVKVFKNNPSPITNWSLNISPEERVNHVVAKADNGTLIMKYINGESLKWGKKQRELPELPNLSYKNLLKQLQNAYENGMSFDAVPSNVIYNPKEKKLTAIDFLELNYFDGIYQNLPLKDTFCVLKENKMDETSKSYNRKLGGKILNVVIDELKSNKKPDFDIEKPDVLLFFNKLRLSQDNNVPPQFDILHKTTNNIIDLSKEKTQSTEKELNGQLKIAQYLINQVLLNK